MPVSPATVPSVDISELVTFVVVAELGSFGAAARRLHLSQPAVTTRVKKLESLLGVKLLNRTPRNVSVTETGRQVADRIRQSLHNLHVLVAEFTQQRNANRRRVVVAASTMLAATLLPAAIGRYCATHPDVDITVIEGRHAGTVEAVERGYAELGYLAMDDPQPHLRFITLAREPLVLVTPQGHPLADHPTVALRQLADWPVMVLEHYSELQRMVVEAYEQQGLQFRPATTATNLSTLLGLLDAGRGVVLLPRCMAQHNASQPRAVVPLADCELVRNYGVMSLRRNELGAAARSFMQFLIAEASIGNT